MADTADSCNKNEVEHEERVYSTVVCIVYVCIVYVCVCVRVYVCVCVCVFLNVCVLQSSHAQPNWMYLNQI